MRRRKFIALLGGAAAAWPLASYAQQGERARLVGVLMTYAENDPDAQSLIAAFRSALTRLGWAENNNLRIEFRWAAGDADKIKTFAKEIVDLRPDAILGQDTFAVQALSRETRTIPIVFATVADPIGSKFAASLAHPGGNITGFTSNDSGLGGK
jgi:putative tryptophan/tyrosine transport system substrate-binding protein